MASVRIFQEPKSAMQSGHARMHPWRLEFDRQIARDIEPLMGWTSGADMRQQVQLTFATREEAIAYATRNGLSYRVDEQQAPARRGMSYSDNFKFNRVGAWTH